MFVSSNIIGSFAFEEKIIEAMLFKDTDVLHNYTLLLEGKQPKEEIELAKKHNAKIADKKMQQKLMELLKAQYDKEFYAANMIIVKQKVKESVHADNLIIQSINSVDELEKTLNLLSKRLREWYELYNPESSRMIKDHEKFISEIISKSKEELQKEFSIKFSMGADLKEIDVKQALIFAEKIKTIYEFKEVQKIYVEKVMKENFPNLEFVAGSQIGAKLIAQASGIERLSSLPSSTLQLLGAEKALFRHMKTGAKPPKYGIIINHPLVSNAKKEDKGKIARALANKLSIAAKVDFFKGEFVGDKLKKQLDDKFGK